MPVEARSQGGSLRDLVGKGYIAPVWWNGREILRRIFVTVRDRRWCEIAPTQVQYSIDEVGGVVTFKARHISEEVDFEWQGVLKVSEDYQQLRFAIEGKALRDMEVCRIGLIILHPVDAMIDSQLSLHGPAGNQCMAVSRLIAPQLIVNGLPRGMTEPFSGLIAERSDFGRLELRLSGDLFEIEDQRNWGDASFKTYCTPLGLGFPRKVKAGTAIEQSVEARFVPAAPSARQPSAGQNGSLRSVFPSLERELPLIRLGEPNYLATLQAVLGPQAPPKIQLQVELGTEMTLPDDFVTLLSWFKERVQRLLICGPGNSLPSAQAVERLRQRLESSGSLSFPLLAATRGYFAEFNRGVKFEAPVAGIGFPLTATVHADDYETITENVTALVDMAETARRLTGVSEIVISPLGLYFPRAASPSNFPKDLVRPWLTAVLVHAALAGVTSVTVGADLLEALGSDGSGFLSVLLECAGAQVEPVQPPLPAGIHALTFVSKAGEPARMLVANLASEAASLILDKREVQIPRYGAMWIERTR